MEISARSLQVEAVEQVISRELSLIPTAYGQLVYLAQLIDTNTGLYSHAGTPSDNGRDTSVFWKRRHEAVFQFWVEMTLQRKMADLELYLSSLPADRSELIDTWLRLTPYKYLVPASIQGPERQKHESDLQAILGLLRNLYGVAAPDPLA